MDDQTETDVQEATLEEATPPKAADPAPRRIKVNKSCTCSS